MQLHVVVMHCSFVKTHKCRFGRVSCRLHDLHGDVVALLFACSVMSLSCLDLMLSSTSVVSALSVVGSFVLVRFYKVVIIPLCYLRFFDSCARVPVD